MEKIIGKLFSDYLASENVATDAEYSRLAKVALAQEKELRAGLDEQQTAAFEALFETTSQIHFLEVKDAFFKACSVGVRLSKELII